jgi:prepilin-type N-terminal cleavage/methylation domain-containing protein
MRSRGFTLIELIVVVTISGILVAVAIPSFVWMNARTRAANASNSLLASFELARSEAIRRNMNVSVCRAEDPAIDPPVCSSAAVGAIAGDDWGTGWVVFAKTSGGVAFGTFENLDTVIKAEQIIGAANPRVVVVSSGAPQFYSFRNDGMSLGTGAPIGITFGIDYRNPAVATVSGAGRCLAFNMTGRANSYAPTAGVC